MVVSVTFEIDDLSPHVVDNFEDTLDLRPKLESVRLKIDYLDLLHLLLYIMI